MEHVDEWIKMETVSLGTMSEQTGESLHQDFRKKWNHYLVKEVENASYADRQFKCVTAH